MHYIIIGLIYCAIPHNTNTSDTILSSNIICNEKMKCTNYDLNCPPNTDCNIVCNGFQSCKGANLLCPSNAKCSIDGYHQQSLSEMTITATQSSSLTLNCSHSSDACNAISVYCPNNRQSTACSIMGVTENDIKGLNVCNF